MNPALVRKQRIIVIALFLLIVATIVVGMGIGQSSLSFNRLLPTLFGHGTFMEHFVLYELRLPRIVVTLLSGMALALSGAILQSLSRNDLADPGVIGINAGAGVGVAVFFLYAPIEPGSLAYLLPVVAFAGAFLTACLIYVFSYSKAEGLQPTRLVLIGIGVATSLSGLMFVIMSSAEREKVDFISKWLAGSIWGTDWPSVLSVLPWLIVLIPFALMRSNSLNLLSMHESVAVSTGVSVSRERILLLLSAVALAASAVSVSGAITFVGLMAPHIAKALVGPRHQMFIPVSVLMGGWLLLLADTIGHNIAPPDGVAAGIVVAFIGAPYFIYLLLRK
ncbi:iron ABC transporter permease [Cohnella lubricantis]|uniref:Iron ABC transporter permease n=1 Tax=Cohnella lubricantis TaxID=2163172 RepID=A0A841TEC8_9BACL|nr:iron ABC transporter permease [Cohnella lubricantis]MBB6679783.1 iron ABC transporter permease [Cohnella lubricantis]MBP2120235.1 iron complex transport system permease protein [Cohnella lubricantis]